tara:strand:- start:38540 stop:41497 length:2958 start_codon:yes stop_codon:yes gene_type:complete
MSGFVVADDVEPERNCEILVDWDIENGLDDSGEFVLDLIIHRYLVTFDPAFENGESPSAVTVDINHIREGIVIGTEVNSSIVVAGGEVDIIIPSEPVFLDEIEINVQTSEASCSRSFNMTMWNQPTSDHEITRETTWELDGSESDASTLYFEGRGWQKRQGEVLTASELGNGSLFLNADTGNEQIILSLDLDRVWMNETHEGNEITSQIFEMRGVGQLQFDSNSEDDDISVEAIVNDAYILRSWQNGILTERIRIDATGHLSFNGGSNNSSEGAFGELSVFYFETWDEDGVRRLSDNQIEANMTVRIQSVDEVFSFELDEFRSREKWVDGIREDSLLKIKGSGDFGFPIREDQFNVQVNGTISDLHIEERGGEVVEDRLIVDGEYSGDVSGSFGLVRQIEQSDIQSNSTGENFEVDIIRNEVWFNVSSTPIGPISQDFQAEHNLTFEYTVPQTDWENRIIRYQYVEDNGNTSNEYPEISPIIVEPERPSYDGDLNITGFRESGIVPSILKIGDSFPTSTEGITPMIRVIGISQGLADGHIVELAEWEIISDNENLTGFGNVINEGILAGLVHNASRIFEFELPGVDDNSVVRLIENQNLERVLYPSIITAAENTPPNLLSLSFREGVLYTEGGSAHIEALIEDVDTDVIGVTVDLSVFGLGLVTLSDSGLNGDAVIHDSIWTSFIEYQGLEFGLENVSVHMNDLWTDVEAFDQISITNAAPRITSREFIPNVAYRGDSISVSIGAEDGHGVEYVMVDLLSSGGELVELDFDMGLNKWVGEFTVPNSLAPGAKTIPLQVSDTQGGSAFLDDGVSVTIVNEAPTITNISFIKDGAWVSVLEIPKKESTSYLMEVTIDDPDGVSSAQTKIGRLAPIGKSETWLSLVDDGTGADRIANDGVFTMEFSLRSTLSSGQIGFQVRASDIFQSMTPIEEQMFSITIVEESTSGGSSSDWLSENSTSLVIIGLLLLLSLAATAVVMTLRDSELD